MAFDLEAAAGSAFGNIAGGLLTNASNKREAERNRSFQAYMSNTSHQREVKDLKAAGLNPLLSATGGASTPTGAQATMENVASGAISSALQAGRIKTELDVAKQGIATAESAEKLNNANATKAGVEAAVLSRGIPKAEIQNDIYEVVKPFIKKLKGAAQEVSSKPIPRARNPLQIIKGEKPKQYWSVP